MEQILSYLNKPIHAFAVSRYVKRRGRAVCGVRVATWDTEQGKHFALKHTFDQELFGGNTGHAAISLTIPVTVENTELIKKYCSDPAIPV